MASIQPLRTITVELSKPHSLKLLKELEHLEAIKIIPNKVENQIFELPNWHKVIIDQRMKEYDDNSKDVMKLKTLLRLFNDSI